MHDDFCNACAQVTVTGVLLVLHVWVSHLLATHILLLVNDAKWYILSTM